MFAQYLPKGATILEVGSANGRDARYWASLGHRVIALDFSVTALNQLIEIGSEQGVMDKITPLVWDVNSGSLPYDKENLIDAFYARSALHVDDDTMMQIADHIDDLLLPGGFILIEGKGPNDQKIARSHKKEGGVAIDPLEQGHLRRIWTTEFANTMCEKFNWNIIHLTDTEERWQGTPASFMRLVARKAIQNG